MNYKQPDSLSVQSLAENPVQWAASMKWFHSPERLESLCKQGFSVEFTPNAEELGGMQSFLMPYIALGISFRFHAFFPELEFGDVDLDRSRQAMKLHNSMFAIVADIFPDTNITCHIGLSPRSRVDENRMIDNLGILVESAKRLGLTLSIENLKAGISSDPVHIKKWAEATNAAITMDLGHALSSTPVMEGLISIHEIIDLFSSRLVEVHYYERETSSHQRPENMSILGPVVEHLLLTNCRWWTIELDELQDIFHTRSISEDYLGSIMTHHSLPVRG